MKVLKGILFTLLAIILVLVIAFVVVINLTPRQLGLADMQISGESLEGMGLADVKIKSIYKSVNNLSKVKEEDVVHNSYDNAEQKDKSKDNFDGSTLSGKDDYSSLVADKATYDKQYLVTYEDKTIAYIFNNIIQNGTSSSSEAVKALKNAKIVVKEMTIDVKDGKGYLRVVSMIELGEYKAQIEEALGSAKNILKVPEKAYIVSEFGFDVDKDGKMNTSSISVSVNGNNDDPVTKAIVNVVMKNASEPMTMEELNEKLGNAIGEVVLNLGKIGTAKVDENNVIGGDINYGMVGVSAHKLCLVTYTK